jgi:hypothetical protein
VSNINGCSATKTETICVLDVQVPNQTNKVYLCHVPPGNPDNPQLLTISVNAVPAHLTNHAGDRLGQCSQTCGSGFNRDVAEQDNHEVEVNIAPNPFSSGFTLQFAGHPEDRAEVRIYDVTGRLVESASNLEANMGWTLGTNYRSGVYVVQFILGVQRTTLRVVKME